ncbi:uncharacterized protein [Leptinotarsa decemlineata]|uniref:uncharacterized protein n=1 Tax=Leptinotarsa decemlineata TaxID=7539 RepID=UPI003D308026
MGLHEYFVETTVYLRMDRKTKILNMVKNNDEVLDRLLIPKYESTKGLGRNEISVLLSRRYILLNERKNCSLSPDPVRQIQLEEISSTKKRYATRLWVEKTKRNIFHCSSDNNNEEIVTSTVETKIHQYDKTQEIAPSAPNREIEQECTSNTIEKVQEKDMLATSDIESEEFIPPTPGIDSDEDYIPNFESPDRNSDKENSIIIPNQNFQQTSENTAEVLEAKNVKKKTSLEQKRLLLFLQH